MPTVYLIHPSHSYSTHDVFTGIADGLRANGVTVKEYRLDRHYRQLEAMAEAVRQEPYNLEVSREHLDGYASHIALGQALWERPDLVLAVSGTNLHYAVPLLWRKYGVRTAVYLTECPYELDHERAIASLYDIAFTNDAQSVDLLHHPRAYYLPHAYNPAVHHPGPADPNKAVDVCFIGTGFQERRALLAGVNWTGMSRAIRGTLWQNADDSVPVKDTDLSGITDNAVAAAWYRSARINLNHHRTTTVYGANTHIPDGAAASLGPRAYEIAACGGFQISDDSRPELRDVFGGTVPTYRHGDSADLERQIRYYLAHPDERERLRQAQHQAVQPHSWHARSRTLLDMTLA